MVPVTYVNATTGTTLDLPRVSEACRAVDGLLVVDGAQSAGLLLDAAAHTAFFIGASYEWLLAEFGAAVVATSARFDEIARPGLVGYMNWPAPRCQPRESLRTRRARRSLESANCCVR